MAKKTPVVKVEKALDIAGHHKAAHEALSNGASSKALEHVLALLALAHSIKHAEKE